MGITKTEIFTLEQNNIARLAKVLGHPARIAILQHLQKTNDCICGDLVDVIGLAQPTISQHLRELKNIGIIHGTVEGTSICYCIHPDNYTKAKKTLLDFFSNIDSSNKDCKVNC